MRLNQILIKLKYKLLNYQKVKININIKLNVLSKTDVLKFRSNENNIVNAPATDKDKIDKITVIVY